MLDQAVPGDSDDVTASTTPPVASPTRHRQCVFCPKTFSRADAARRHAKTCTRRAGKQLPHRQRGRPGKACEQCSKIKVHCAARSGSACCERCASRQLRCSFVQSITTSTQVRWNEAEQLDAVLLTDTRYSLTFILNSLDDRHEYITERAIAQEPPAPDVVRREQHQALFDPTLSLPGDDQAWMSLLDWDDAVLRDFLHDVTPAAPSPSNGPVLVGRLSQLGSELRQHATHRLEDDAMFNTGAFSQLFTADNAVAFAAMFCQKRHYQYSLLHWPTFDLQEAPLPLLLAVVLTGAAYSVDKGNHHGLARQARSFYRLADSFIFWHLEKCAARCSSTGSKESSQVQACQAALLMYALDNISLGDKDLRLMAVRKRLPALAYALRDFDFIACRHDCTEDWATFLHREQIVRIVAWTYCADCLATLCFSQPPLLTSSEMTGDLPCESLLFESDAMPQASGGRQHKTSTLARLVPTLLAMDEQAVDQLEQPTVAEVHIMICAFQQVLFNVFAASALGGQSQSLLRALDSWRRLWAKALADLAPEEHKWLGVAKYASGLEVISRRIIEVSIDQRGSVARSSYLQRTPTTDTKALHTFLKDFVV